MNYVTNVWQNEKAISKYNCLSPWNQTPPPLFLKLNSASSFFLLLTSYHKKHWCIDWHPGIPSKRSNITDLQSRNRYPIVCRERCTSFLASSTIWWHLSSGHHCWQSCSVASTVEHPSDTYQYNVACSLHKYLHKRILWVSCFKLDLPLTNNW